eukprot:2835044-Pyramimonas_sp.AAC.1
MPVLCQHHVSARPMQCPGTPHNAFNKITIVILMWGTEPEILSWRSSVGPLCGGIEWESLGAGLREGSSAKAIPRLCVRCAGALPVEGQCSAKGRE